MSLRKTGLEQFRLDEQAIIELVAAREVAWNAGDTVAYAQLLTEDVDIVSATGRPARGREALADVSYELEGGSKVDAVSTIRRGIMAFVLRKHASRWRIAAIRSIPER